VTKVKSFGTLAAVALILAAIYGVGLFDPSKKKDKPGDGEVAVSVHASQTVANRGDKNVIVIVVVNDKALPPFYPSDERWDMPLVVKKGSSVGVGVWQFTQGSVACAIRRDGRAVSTDISTQVSKPNTVLTPEQAVQAAAKCYYLAV
jgi:hypothetical protein